MREEASDYAEDGHVVWLAKACNSLAKADRIAIIAIEGQRYTTCFRPSRGFTSIEHKRHYPTLDNLTIDASKDNHFLTEQDSRNLVKAHETLKASKVSALAATQ